MKKKTTRFVIRGRFVGDVPRNLESRATGNVLFLGKRGQWVSLEKALVYRTTRAAELALQDKWNRLHNAGTKSVILSVVKV